MWFICNARTMVTFNWSQSLLYRLNHSNSTIMYRYIGIQFTNHGSSLHKWWFSTRMPCFWQTWIQTLCWLWNETHTRFDVYTTVYRCWLNNYYIVPFGGGLSKGYSDQRFFEEKIFRMGNLLCCFKSLCIEDLQIVCV